VRELQNAIERAFALSAADTISVEDLPPVLASTAAAAPLLPADGELPTLEEAERRLITTALHKSGGNKNEAARLLGIDRQRLYRKIEKYRI
jgi:DNA-binding NtrC family response regulator